MITRNAYARELAEAKWRQRKVPGKPRAYAPEPKLPAYLWDLTDDEPWALDAPEPEDEEEDDDA